MSSSSVSHIYDALFRFENQRKGEGHYPIHKPIDFGRPDLKDITDWIEQHITIPKNANILDAGCGTGYSLSQLCGKHNRTGLGISISEEEVQRANAAANQNQSQGKYEFKVHDYAKPIGDEFDTILAIESIKHAADIRVVCENLYSHLRPGGQLLILEDFYIPGKGKDSLSQTFMKHWSVKDMYTENFFIKTFESLGARQGELYDFTELVPQKSAWKTKFRIRLTQLLSKFFGDQEKKALMHIYIGALIMDYYYTIGAFEYKMLVIQKPGGQTTD